MKKIPHTISSYTEPFMEEFRSIDCWFIIDNRKYCRSVGYTSDFNGDRAHIFGLLRELIKKKHDTIHYINVEQYEDSNMWE